MSRRTVLWAIAVLIVLRGVVLIGLWVQPDVSTGRGNLTGDIRRFHQIAVQAGVPYKDRAVEYPIVTYAAIRVLAIGNVPTSARTIAVFSLLCDIAVAGALAYGWSRRAALIYLLAGLAYLVIPLIYLRMDLLSIALAMWGLALVRRNRQRWGGALIGVAVFTKLWPALLLPLAWLTGRRRAAYFGAGATAGLFGIWAAIGGLSGPIQVLTFRGAQGWQIESVVGAFVRILVPGKVYAESGALRYATIPGWTRSLLSALLLASLVAVMWWVWRGSRRRSGLLVETSIIDGVSPLAMITAMLVFSPLFSPQYGVWLLPFAAIAWVEREREIAGVAFMVTTGSAILLSRIIAVKNGAPLETVVLLARNLLAVYLVAIAMWRVAQWARQRPQVIDLRDDVASLEPVSATHQVGAVSGHN